MSLIHDVIIVGGGAAGYFTAIQLAEKVPSARICILEKNPAGLQKVKVSGGGRCNVTNQETDPHQLAQFYPRGFDFLESPFRRFGSKETKNWFQKRGVALKTEADGRVFPLSNTSQTVLDLFQRLVQLYQIEVFTKVRVTDFEKSPKGWNVFTSMGDLACTHLVITVGSDQQTWKVLSGYMSMVDPVPSLFTFHIEDEGLRSLTGTSFPQARVSWPKVNKTMQGPMLITHWGISGPAVLKLSAWAALTWNQTQYHGEIEVDWTGGRKEECEMWWQAQLAQNPKKTIVNTPPLGFSNRFWLWILSQANIPTFTNYAEFGKKQRARLLMMLTQMPLQVSGKSTFKEEFVTAGGVDLNEIDPNTFESRKYPSLYFAGEVLNIDAVTGGFNFQAAWTGGWHVAQSIARSLES